MWNEQHDSILQKEFGFYFSLDNGSRTRRSGWQSLRQNTIFPCSENALPCMLPLRFQARCLFL